MESIKEYQWPRTLFQLNLKPIQSQNNFFSDKILSYSKKKKES